jgi:hypothetical protein
MILALFAIEVPNLICHGWTSVRNENGQNIESRHSVTGKTCESFANSHSMPQTDQSLLQLGHRGQQSGAGVLQLDQSLLRKGRTEIKGDYIVVNGLRYSRKGAEAGNLGTVGKLMHPLGVPPIVHFQAPPPKAWTRNNVKMETIANITSDQVIQLGISAKVSYGGALGEGSFNINGSHSAAMIIQKFGFTNKWKILHWMNKDTNAAWVQMFRSMDMPRIVTKAWILVDQSVPEIGRSCVGGELTIEFQGQGGSIFGSGCGSSVWSFSPGSVIAYRMSKVVFDREGAAIRLEADIGTR